MRAIIRVCSALLLLALLVVCPVLAASQQVVIGADLEISGAVATLGKSAMEGMQLATDQQNARGGVLGQHIELVVLDNRSEVTETANQATRLIAEKRVVAIIGPVTSGNCKAAGPIAQGRQVVLFTPSATNPTVTNIGSYIFRACFLDSYQGETIAKFAALYLNKRHMAILVENGNDYARGLAVFTASTFKQLGGQVVAQEFYAKGEKDFSSALTKIKTLQPDIIVLPNYYDTVGLCIKQAREMGIKVAMIGGDGWDSPLLLQTAGAKNLNNTFFTNHYTPLDPTPLVQTFVKQYQARYHKTPDTLAALGYDSALILFDAIRRAKSIERTAIRNALASTVNFKGVTGTVTMGKDRNPIKSISVLELKDGKQLLRMKINPK